MVVSRVFKQKLKSVMAAICGMFPSAGKVQYKMHVIEFQKRGLPHAHILIKFEKDCMHPRDIDQVISAEIPNDLDDVQLVLEFMMHRHNYLNANGQIRTLSCQKLTSAGTYRCRFSYPHQIQNTTTIDAEGRVLYRRRKPGDEWVVPHCLPLLRKFRCHIDFESASTSRVFSYLFKYVHKGVDKAQFQVQVEGAFDEVVLFWTGHYLSAGEAA